MKKKFLAAKIVFVAALSSITPVQAGGIPVFDGINLPQNILTAIESVTQTLKQIQQYKAQLQQYQNQLQNTIAPAAYIWDQSQTTINKIMTTVNTLDHYKKKLGSLDNYIKQFQDVNYYKSSPCFSPTGCSDAEWAAMQSVQQLASESQKEANGALFKGLEEQSETLSNDAKTLGQLQKSAQGAQGQMQAIGYANQLASQQANQLLIIRSLLITQQNAIGSKMQADADKEARQEAAAKQLRAGRFVPSTPRFWYLGK